MRKIVNVGLWPSRLHTCKHRGKITIHTTLPLHTPTRDREPDTHRGRGRGGGISPVALPFHQGRRAINRKLIYEIIISDE